MARSFRLSRWCLILVRVSSDMIVTLYEQLTVLLQGPLGDLGESLLQLSPGAFVSDRFQGPWDRLGSQDSFDRSALKSLIAEGVFDRPTDILALIIFLQPQDGSGVESTVAGIHCGESLEKRPGHLS
jgi:hypothetical protein